MITIDAAKLANLLTDLLDTADDVRGVHLATHRTAIGDEPGETDVLAGLSCTTTLVGHTWTDCIGQEETTIWPIDATVIAIGICKAIASKDNTVDIRSTLAEKPADLPEGEHPGYVVTVSETPALFDSDTVFEFHAAHENSFPLDMCRNILTVTGELAQNPKIVEINRAGLATIWNPKPFARLLAIAKRRTTAKHTEHVRLYRSPDRMVQRAQIGENWLGAIMPAALPESSAEPTAEPLLPHITN